MTVARKLLMVSTACIWWAWTAPGTCGENPSGGNQPQLEVFLNESVPQASFLWCGAYLLWKEGKPGAPAPLGKSALPETAPSTHGQNVSPAVQVLVLEPAGEVVIALPPGSTAELRLLLPAPWAEKLAAVDWELSFWAEPACDLQGNPLLLPDVMVDPLPVCPGSDGSRAGETSAVTKIAALAELLKDGRRHPVTVRLKHPGAGLRTRIVLCARSHPSAIRLGGFAVTVDDRRLQPMMIPGPMREVFPPPRLPAYLPGIDAAIVEWDWRLQDGIGTPREPASFAEATERVLDRVDALLRYRSQQGVDTELPRRQLAGFAERRRTLLSSTSTTEEDWRHLWREVHWWRRKLLFSTLPLPLGPIAFVKHVPSAFSHQLTQYYGRDARPGGGVCLLPEPGKSLTAIDLVGQKLPCGSYQHLDVSGEGDRLLFAFCEVDKAPADREMHGDRFFQLYELMLIDGSVRRLTDGPFDHFSPRYLPDGRIVFVSTRRGGFHRCGRGPCPVYTLSVLEQDGTIRVISYHETHEWDPAVLHDGRIIYTRWDYVDRHAVFYQQLWTVRPDGTNVQMYYGNGTFNPVGIWEAVPVPGSTWVMATAAPHHAMTAGSIILLDINRGLDGPAPIERLTPDALFPESEVPVIREPDGFWYFPVGVNRSASLPVEARRWPGHCYRSPWPISKDHFLAAYSYDPLIGEPTANRPNTFGIYLVDRFGNKELVYRDLNHCSLWPVLATRRPGPRVVASQIPNPVGLAERQDGATPLAGGVAYPLLARDGNGYGGSGLAVSAVSARRIPQTPPVQLPERSGPIGEGIFIVQNVHEAWPELPPVKITRLRIVQVLPKTTPHINTPPVGLANASPGKQVLGTVPVEPDGSAYFVAPAGVPLSFQALDELGQAVQMMRSVTYLQPGEITSCIGCHQPRQMAPPVGPLPAAVRREPSRITPGPPGSRPLSYPRLVQPILDRHCVRCHNDEQADGGINLVGRPQGQFSVSYLALAPRVRISAWDGRADFLTANCEPYTRADFFGARGSPLMQLLLTGHGDVELSAEEIEALAAWMDTNALFYGTFDPADQARQLRGEEIPGPAWE